MITYKKLYKPNNLNRDEIVLDIETTGLDASLDQLVVLGLITFENNKCYIIQYFAEDDKEEIRLLSLYLKHIENKRIITYNGDKFDIPFLNYRLMEHKLNPIFANAYDIYKVISKHRKYFEFESMKLTDIEKKIGIYRDDPSRYKVISKLSDGIKKRVNPWPILIHNENDLIATEKLANASDYFKDLLSFDSIKFGKFYLESIWINNDIGQITLSSDSNLEESYFNQPSYELKVSESNVEINIQLIYGRFDSENTGHVAINTFGLKNESDINIDSNLFIIRENRIYNYKNILNLSKKIIETHL